MNTYLVGGAVRDRLLGRAVKDRDHVVVGQTPEAMLAAGFQPVGRDFPVFLHPHTREEHALARTERKSGRGYRGFVVSADATVTLEDDLRRRDLTINAIAEAPDGALVDPFGGVRDLEARVLRHVSDAFSEDPVRILRVARFAARYAPLGFRIAPETMQLMRQMVGAGEADHLVPERVFQELRLALGEPRPGVFVRVLRACGALRVIVPELDALYGVPQRIEFHPEYDAGVHLELELDAAARLAPGDAQVGYAVLLHDLGKALTPREVLPRHLEHESRGVPPLRAVCARLRAPADFAALAEVVCREHLNLHRARELRPGSMVDLIERLDGYRQPQRIDRITLACAADKLGRAGESIDRFVYPARDLVAQALVATLRVDARPFLERGLRGPEVGAAVREERCRMLSARSVC
ncbi:MAG: multifunctional CCA addition/repair protein [Rhodanobacteraceae bacterium]|nr:multifunctional CCA addition/repair protein [Rhodanobacteraceae bacterium]